MSNTGRLSTFRAFEHDIGDVKGHGFLDNASLARLPLRADVLLHDISALNNYFADLRERPRNRPLLTFILACDNQNGVTLFDIHLVGEVERPFLFLFDCHLFPR
jgi:hypothetical protein